MIDRINRFFSRPVDNAPLIVFRVCFGLIVAAEGFGAISTGWVKRAFITPDLTFPFIWIDWLQPLPGDGMIYYYALMGICGILISLGAFYRLSTILFFLLWSGTYFMQKTHYNNHYYFMVLLAGIMSVFPAHRSHSLDVRWGRAKQEDHCHHLVIVFMIAQVMIVYLFASVNKVYADWLDAKPIAIWFEGKKDYWLIGSLLVEKWFQYVIAYGGIVFDGLVSFGLLYRRTRKFTFILSVIFHLFNSIVFQIGIFPYVMIALCVFFYPGDYIRKFFRLGRRNQSANIRALPLATIWVVVIYFLWQIYLPLRHYGYEGKVLWTEEGHRLAWQMMLRTKSGRVRYKLVNKSNGNVLWINPNKYLTYKQSLKVATMPDMTWQFAQFLENEFEKNGEEYAVYAHTNVSLNGSKHFQLIDPEANLADLEWDYFSHSPWIRNP